MRASGLSLRARPTFRERQALDEIGWALVRPETVVYDIGAATGIYTLAAAKVNTVRQVVAFEPLSESFATLEGSAAAYPLVRCFNVALGDENGETRIHRSEWRNTSSLLPVGELTRREFPTAARLEEDEPVAIRRLDDLVAEYGLEPPDVVKMDVQGFEDHVIRGGGRTLRSARLCIVELSFQPLYEGAPLFDDVYALFRELGFRLNGLWNPIRGSDGSVMWADGIFERSGSDT